MTLIITILIDTIFFRWICVTDRRRHWRIYSDIFL